MARRQRRGRRRVVVLTVALAGVGAVAVVRRRRLDAATADFHERYGPLDPSASAT